VARNRVDWRTIIRRIKSGKFAPFIGRSVVAQHLPGAATFAQDWADEVAYPFPLAEPNSLTSIAQYLSITSRDALSAKEDYLEFMKQHLLDAAKESRPADQGAFFEALEDELFDLTYSEVVTRLGYPEFEDELDNPLRVLAELPIPIYLTTSPHTFIEEALKAAGKEATTEFAPWHQELEDSPSIFESDPDFQPSEETPLVYHLHGLDNQPSSLVLSEDDYLDFLVRISEDNELIPRRVTQVLGDSSLLLLGYKLQGWDFRVLFRGMISSKRATRRLASVSIQISPEEEEGEKIDTLRDVEDYLQSYFGKANFDNYWGSAENFTTELWEQWES
jgi:hypothetical protein